MNMTNRLVWGQSAFSFALYRHGMGVLVIIGVVIVSHICGFKS